MYILYKYMENFMEIHFFTSMDNNNQGRIQGRAPGARPPPPPKIGKNMICWCKIVIFHTKYLKNFRASLRSAQFF